MRFTKTMAEMRELAVARAADVVRDVSSVIHRALHADGFDMGGSGAAFVVIANAAYARALHEVMMEHAAGVPMSVVEGGIGTPLGAAWPFGAALESVEPLAHARARPVGQAAEPHAFLPAPGKPEEPPSCALCGQEDAALIHHPDLIATLQK